MKTPLILHAVLAFAYFYGAASFASQADVSEWQIQKCGAYEDAWTEALAYFGSDGLNDDFVANNESFIAGDCTDQGQVCPRSSEELQIANALTIAVMNAGAASTFPPFKCD